MKTEKEIDEYRKEIEKRLIGTESMDAMKYYQVFSGHLIGRLLE